MTFAINGWFDHLHLIVAIPPKIAIADVVKPIKGASSHSINHSCDLPDQFAWQRGYGVLSLGESQRSAAETYVRQQKHHHRTHTTNSWLERSDEHDEGPLDHGLTRSYVPSPVRETAASHATDNPFPF
jgi:putative transposase